jgi:hypothetical protein
MTSPISHPSNRRFWLDAFGSARGDVVYPLAGLLGFLYAIHFLPGAYIDGSSPFWLLGDPAQHVSTWWAYAKDQWRFPLLKTTLLNHPRGMILAFADALPLAALILKPLAAWLPKNFHYFGYYTVLAAAAQGVAGAALIRAAGNRGGAASLLAAFLFATSPLIIWRLFGHTSLTSHFLLLSALAFYLQGVRRAPSWSLLAVTASFTLLAVAALLTHPYFMVMVLAIYLAALVDGGASGWHPLGRLLAPVVTAAVLLAVMALVGYFELGGQGGGGFGFYSTNPAGFFYGGRILDHFQPGQVAYDPFGGQYEGNPYPGLGVLLLLAAVLVRAPLQMARSALRSPALGLVLLLMALYAVSNVVTFGPRVLLAVGHTPYLKAPALMRVSLVEAAAVLLPPLAMAAAWFFHRRGVPWRYCLAGLLVLAIMAAAALLLARPRAGAAYELLTRQFRASGRFAWPLVYVVTLAAIAGLFRFYPRRVALVLAAAAAVVQFVDLAPLRRGIQQNIACSSVIETEYRPWRPFFEHAAALHVFPYYGCPGYDPGRTLILQVLAAERGIPFNTAYFSRGDYRCPSPAEDLGEAQLESDTLYLFMPPHRNHSFIAAHLPRGRTLSDACLEHPWGTICLPGASPGTWPQVPEPFTQLGAE